MCGWGYVWRVDSGYLEIVTLNTCYSYLERQNTCLVLEYFTVTIHEMLVSTLSGMHHSHAGLRQVIVFLCPWTKGTFQHTVPDCLLDSVVCFSKFFLCAWPFLIWPIPLACSKSCSFGNSSRTSFLWCCLLKFYLIPSQPCSIQTCLDHVRPFVLDNNISCFQVTMTSLDTFLDQHSSHNNLYSM